MSKFTPGPWGISVKEGNAGFDVYAENQPIADIRYIKGESASSKGIAIEEANARLIAAAPDLLDACKAMEKLFFMCGSGVHAAGGVIDAINTAKTQAKAAIAAATE